MNSYASHLVTPRQWAKGQPPSTALGPRITKVGPEIGPLGVYSMARSPAQTACSYALLIPPRWGPLQNAAVDPTHLPTPLISPGPLFHVENSSAIAMCIVGVTTSVATKRQENVGHGR
mmetsp:Transcript_49788/g.89054  ORF Transcript_49788/g.89054 Transcript_49788/m.89054 type:complete len:118 (+) Transcript_49788:86-439(+)